jgi:tetratricopeptide (TPR) repeat protein
MQDFKGSAADFDQAIKLQPNNPGLYANRGSALSMLGDKKGAMADYDTALRLEPGHPINHVNRAMLLTDMGDTAGALTAIRKALAIAPDFPPALEQLKKIEAARKSAAKK